MSDFFYLIALALVLGAVGLLVFLWSLRSGQYEDLDGAAERILFDDDVPLKENRKSETEPDNAGGGGKAGRDSRVTQAAPITGPKDSLRA